MADRTLIHEFARNNDIYAGATVAAFTIDGAGQPTSTLATLYAAISGGDVVANPQALDSRGRFKQPVYFDVPVVLRVSSAFAPSHDSGVIRPNLSTADVTAAQAAATAAAVSAAAAASSAIEAQAAAATGGDRYWPNYWRHAALFPTAY